MWYTFNMAFNIDDYNNSGDLEDAISMEDAVLNEATKFLSPAGLLTNLIFLYVVLRVRAMRSVIYIYLVNVAVADTSYLAISLSSIWLSHPLLATLRNILSSSRLTCRIASCCFITALAVDRYFAVTTPMFRIRATKSRAGKISVALWAVALSSGILHFVISNLKDPNKLTYSALRIIVHAAVLFINAALYTSIVKTLNPASSISGNRIIGIVILNTAVFFLYNLMAIIFSAVTLIQDVSDDPYLDGYTITHLKRCVSILYLISCSINPIIYSVANADRRAAFLKAFSCLTFCSCKRDTERNSNQRIELKLFRSLPEPGDSEEGRQGEFSRVYFPRSAADATSIYARSESPATSPTFPGIEPLPRTSQGPVSVSEFEPATNHRMGSVACPLLMDELGGGLSVYSPMMSRCGLEENINNDNRE